MQSSVFAQIDNLKVNGYAEGQFGGMATDVKGNFFFDSSLTTKLDDTSQVRTDFAMGFGSATYESRGGSASINDAFITYNDDNLGHIEIGITHPVTEKFRLDSSTFARGSGGINGDYFRYVKYGLDSSNMILSPQMPTAGGFATSNYIGVQNNLGTLQNYFNGARGTKISAISKKIYGFTFGSSFTPSLYDKYTTIGSVQNETANLQDINNNFNTRNSISLATKYERDITRDFNVSISALYEYGRATELSQSYTWCPRENLNAWSLGFNTKYQNLYFGGSYSGYGHSLFFKPDGTSKTMKINNDGSVTDFNSSYLYNIGFGYVTEKWGISSSYFTGEYMSNKSHIINVSLDKKIKINQNTFVQYIELAYVTVQYPNYYQETNLKIDNQTKAFVIFCGIRLTI